MKSLRPFFLLLAVVLLASPAIAQNHVIKLTPLKLVGPINNLQLGYEGVIAPRVTIGADLKIALPNNISGGDFVVDTLGTESGEFQNGRLSGFSITPQVRFYLGGKDAPEGFYLSPWLRFFRYSVDSDVIWYEAAGNSNIDAQITWGGFGFGGSLGWQWFLGEHVVIDWNMGLGVNPTRMGLSGTVSGPLEADVQDFIDEVNAGLADAPLITGTISGESTGLGGKTGFFPMPVFRSNLSIGYAF